MALQVGGTIPIKGKVLTTKGPKAWAQEKFGEWWQLANIEGTVTKASSKTVKIDLGDSVTVELNIPRFKVAPGDDDWGQSYSCFGWHHVS